MLDYISPRILWNYFHNPVAVAPRFLRKLTSSVDCFAVSGKGPGKKKEPNPIYSEPYYCIGPDSETAEA